MKLVFPKKFRVSDISISGIYFIVRKNKIVYIGKSVNIFSRLNSEHKYLSFHKYDYIRFIQCKKSLIDRYEKRWILKFKPEFNHKYVSTYFWPNGFGSKRLLRKMV